MKYQCNRTFHIITPILVGKFSKFTPPPPPPYYFEARDVSENGTPYDYQFFLPFLSNDHFVDPGVEWVVRWTTKSSSNPTLGEINMSSFFDIMVL